ncbi:MAG TPA: hypothetical protein VIH59_24235 [Candidatus Tectomicrobia bacterium]|jgi:hypothetical protein
MAETTVKHKVLKAIEELPHDATFEDVLERLYFLYKITGALTRNLRLPPASAPLPLPAAGERQRCMSW